MVTRTGMARTILTEFSTFFVSASLFSRLRGQLQGDLDDNKLIDRVTGERRVFRKRGTPEKRHGLYQSKPKRLIFAVDVSASMARMNAWDGQYHPTSRSPFDVRVREPRPSLRFYFPTQISQRLQCKPQVSIIESSQHKRPPR